MKILNIGSLNIDYVYSVEHFVRPGETLSSSKLEIFCGGKGLNQSVAAARAGAAVYHAGAIGSEGAFLKEHLKNSGVNVDYVQTVNSPSGHAIIQVDKSGQNCILLFGGANRTISKNHIDRALAGFEAGDILLLQNEINNLEYIIKQAHLKGMQIALNPSPYDENILSLPLELVTYFILNEIEGQGLTGQLQPEQIAKTLLSRYPNSKIVLTLGKRGVVYYDADQSLSHGIYKVKPVDTTAAGDTFTGYFLASVCHGLTVEKALERASVASSIAVSRPGASPSIPTLDEVLNHNLTYME